MPNKQDNMKLDSADAEARRIVVLKKLRIVIRAAQRHSAWIEKQCGVSGAQLWLIQELYETPGLRVGEVAQKMAIHQTTVSNLLDPLDSKGYVTRKRDSHDQRAIKLELTELGRSVIERAPVPARGLLPEALGHLSEEGLAALDQGLQALLDVIDSADESSGLLPLPFTM